MLLINVSGESQNVDTERISTRFADDIFPSFSTKISNLAIQYLHVATVALVHLFMVVYCRVIV